MNTLMATNASITTASVWLYLTEKGREKKKRPFKYWMNNSEIYFEVSYVHPTHVFDVPSLLVDAYKSFLQSAQVVAYDTERKKDAPIHFPAESCFVNPIIENMNLITWTSMGWTIPFRCTICLPIEKIKYLQLFINGWAIEFTLYAKASSKNKLEAGAPQLFSILGEMQRAMSIGQPLMLQPAATTNAPPSQYYDAMQSQSQYVAARNPQSAGNFVSASENNSIPDFMSPDNTVLRGTAFDPEFGLDPALADLSYESPHGDQSFPSTSDSSDFDSIISNYPDFEEKVNRDIARAREKEGWTTGVLTEKDREKKRRLQGPATATKKDTGDASKMKKSSFRKKESTVKKAKKEQLLTPKKEGDKFTQYYPTSEVDKLSQNPVKQDPHYNHQEVYSQMSGQVPPAHLLAQMQGSQTGVQPVQANSGVFHIGSLMGAQVSAFTPSYDGGFSNADTSGAFECGMGMPINRADEGHTAPSNGRADDSGITSSGHPGAGFCAPTIGREDSGEYSMPMTGQCTGLIPVFDQGGVDPTCSEDDQVLMPEVSADSSEVNNNKAINTGQHRVLTPVVSSEQELAPESDSEDEEDYSATSLKTDVVLPRVPVKPAMVQIAERTGMETEAMQAVIELEVRGELHDKISKAANVSGGAGVEDLHKELMINGQPLKSFDHVLAYTESYAVPAQRNFFFFVDCKNKLRFDKGTPIDVKYAHRYSLHIKEYGKALALRNVSEGATSVSVEHFAGFIAITKADGIVVFVPYAFNK